MQELQDLLKKHDSKIEFHHLNNCIHCYYISSISAHLIIGSFTCISKQFIKALKSKCGSDVTYFNIDDDNNDGQFFAGEKDFFELTLNNKWFNIFDNEDRALYKGLKHNPIKRTCRIVHIICSLDQRKQAFKNVIKTRNESGWFKSFDEKEVIMLCDLELLRDVKT